MIHLYVSKAKHSAWNTGDKYFVFLKAQVLVGMGIQIFLYHALLNIFTITVLENK